MDLDNFKNLTSEQKDFFARIILETDMVEFHKYVLTNMGTSRAAVSFVSADDAVPELLAVATSSKDLIEIPEENLSEISSTSFFPNTTMYVETLGFPLMEVKLNTFVLVVQLYVKTSEEPQKSAFKRQLDQLEASIRPQENLLTPDTRDIFRRLTKPDNTREQVLRELSLPLVTIAHDISYFVMDRKQVFDIVRIPFDDWSNRIPWPPAQSALVLGLKLRLLTMLFWEIGLTLDDPERQIFLAGLYIKVHNQIVAASKYPHRRKITGDPNVEIIELHDANRSVLDLIRT